MTEKLTLGFSPCPNDTFMFDAMVNGKIDTDGLSFDVRMEDIETLNQKALKGELDITKISFAVYPKVIDKYQLLTSGSALGNGVGPLLISKKHFSDPQKEIKSVAIPGKNTTAFLLFRKFFPELTNVVEMPFHEIENSVLHELTDAGVIIHENRFTYEGKGLKKIADLGELWEEKTGKPIPLGGIVVRRSLREELKSVINNLLRKSIEFAFGNRESSREYVKMHSQELGDDVIAQHINLYVNKFSIDIGMEGFESIRMFLENAGLKNFDEIFTDTFKEDYR